MVELENGHAHCKHVLRERLLETAPARIQILTGGWHTTSAGCADITVITSNRRDSGRLAEFCLGGASDQQGSFVTTLACIVGHSLRGLLSTETRFQ